jgi:hypothetical protein
VELKVFKEWAVVCEALAAGKQSILLRKGGIAEKGGQFAFEADSFYFLPTAFHQNEPDVRWWPQDMPSPPADGSHEIRLAAEVVRKEVLSDASKLERLAPFHIWKQEVVQERFEREQPPAISLAILRVYRLQEPLHVADCQALHGCRSWADVTLEGDAAPARTPILDDAAFALLKQQLEEVIDG